MRNACVFFFWQSPNRLPFPLFQKIFQQLSSIYVNFSVIQKWNSSLYILSIKLSMVWWRLNWSCFLHFFFSFFLLENIKRMHTWSFFAWDDWQDIDGLLTIFIRIFLFYCRNYVKSEQFLQRCILSLSLSRIMYSKTSIIDLFNFDLFAWLSFEWKMQISWDFDESFLDIFFLCILKIKRKN